jgi:hypothetical protein
VVERFPEWEIAWPVNQRAPHRDPRAGMAWVAVLPGGPQRTSTWVAQISEAEHKVIHSYPSRAASR